MAPWKSKKAFLYFGGAFIIILGGAIILAAPYHYFWFVTRPGEARPFSVWEGSGYYSQMEFRFSVTPGNTTEVDAEIEVRNSELETIHLFNFSLTTSDAVGPITQRQYRRIYTLDIEVGDYSVIVLRVVGVDIVEIELTQTSDSRLYIVAGGSMNILGLFMGALGYMVAGSFLPSGDEIIIDWGFEDKDEDESPYEPNITG